VRVTLFFTRGVGLRLWDARGMLSREVALYRRLQEQGVEVGFVTYGGADDLAYAERLGGIRVLCNRRGWPQALYARTLCWLHGAWLSGTDLVKSNQTNGAEVALRAARRWGKPLVARFGYMWSDHAAHEHGPASRVARRARRVEAKVFAAAERIVVTTEAMRRDVGRRVPVAVGRTVVIPNYVDTTAFHPGEGPRDDRAIIFVGRLSHQKNVAALLEAMESLDCTVTLIGDGELGKELRSRFRELDSKVRWLGNVPNAALPGHLNRATVFVLPSLYEGHPKALLEAMACGVAVVGADSPGIREVIRHGETGWLCGTDPASLRGAIREVLSRPQLREEFGRNARRYVEEHVCLDRVVALELALYREVIGSRRGGVGSEGGRG
jgi:glycosyltransferase involved in cell wall biosynthesis